MSKIKSFRGKIAHDTQDIIILHTNTGSTGYRIKKFQLMLSNPGTSAAESTVKIYKINQGTTVDSTIDFSDNTLAAAAYLAHDNAPQYSFVETIIFDNEIFNQDIYVTHNNPHGSNEPVNYYIELEQIKLDLNQNTMATLKDIRNETLAI
jgi:hypothetical protein